MFSAVARLFGAVRPVAYDGTWRPDKDCVPHLHFKEWVGELPKGQTRFA